MGDPRTAINGQAGPTVIDRLPDYAAPLVDIIERIMTQHWDMCACSCWVCQEGRAVGCRPREAFLAHSHPEQERPKVRVDWVEAL